MTVEEQILTDSKAFLLSKKEQNFKIETIFDWNEMNIEDILEINSVNLNDFFEQWKKNICKKRSCHHQDKTENVEKQTEIVLQSNSIDKNCLCHMIEFY